MPWFCDCLPGCCPGWSVDALGTPRHGDPFAAARYIPPIINPIAVTPDPVPREQETFEAVRKHLGLDEIKEQADRIRALEARVGELECRVRSARNALGHVLTRSDVPPREVWMAAMSGAFDALREPDGEP